MPPVVSIVPILVRFSCPHDPYVKTACHNRQNSYALSVNLNFFEFTAF